MRVLLVECSADALRHLPTVRAVRSLVLFCVSIPDNEG